MSGAPERTILVLHEPGAPGGGARWDEALRHARWRGRAIVPNLPGHAGTPPPLGGHHELADAALVASALVASLRAAERSDLVVVGIGANGWSAQLVALGRRAGALVLADGLGSPWLDPLAAVASERDRLRAIAADHAAIAPPPPRGDDPRLAHGVPAHGSRRLAQRAAAATTVPTLVVETPRSTTSPADRRDLVARFAGPAQLVELPDDREEATVAAIIDWATTSAAHAATRLG